MGVAAQARICVVRQGHFPFDPRLRREVEALLDAGHHVDVICLRLPGEERREVRGRLVVHRIARASRATSLPAYAFEYGAFFMRAALLMTGLHARRRFDLVQVNSLPDWLVFAASIPKLFGAAVLLDLQEVMPEFFAVKSRRSLRSPLVLLLAALEQAAIRFADHAITCTETMRQRFVARGADEDRIGVILNSADESIFDVRHYPPAPRTADGFRVISHGTLDSAYDVATVVRAAALLHDAIPNLRLEIYGDGPLLPDIRTLAVQLGIGDSVYLAQGFVPIDDLLRAIAAADAGVVAVPRDPFRDLTHCNKMFEFISMRKPALVPRSSAVRAYFGDSCFQLFTAGDPQDLARAIRELHGDPELGCRLVENAIQTATSYRWPLQRRRYLALVQDLVLHRVGQHALGVAD
jgi:glycosyltransferase involved in cell wall biosynthesis